MLNYLLKVWNDELAAAAQIYSQNCREEFYPDSGSMISSFNMVGGNVVSYNTLKPDYVQLINDAWINELYLYNFESNTCIVNGSCTSYKQVKYGNIISVEV